MLHDPRFADRIRSRDPEAAESAGLGAVELDALAKLDPAGVAADRDQRRSAALLRNVTAELALSLAAHPSGWEAGFPCSAEFHRAIARDQSLARALADYAARQRAPRAFRAILRLERALIEARRNTEPSGATPAERERLARSGAAAWVLSPTARLLTLPGGTFEYAAALRASLDAGGPPPLSPRLRGRDETVLIHSRGHPLPGRLRDVHVEPLPGLVAELLRVARAPVAAGALVDFARQHGCEREDVVRVVGELVDEEILVGAPPA